MFDLINCITMRLCPRNCVASMRLAVVVLIIVLISIVTFIFVLDKHIVRALSSIVEEPIICLSWQRNGRPRFSANLTLEQQK
jgi:hypothetical protein